MVEVKLFLSVGFPSFLSSCQSTLGRGLGPPRSPRANTHAEVIFLAVGSCLKPPTSLQVPSVHGHPYVSGTMFAFFCQVWSP